MATASPEGFWDTADALYDMAVETGALIGFAIFDRDIRLPLSCLADSVKGECGEDLPKECVRDLVQAGWLPELAMEESEEPAFCLYHPSRIGLFLRLERGGYESEELRRLADY